MCNECTVNSYFDASRLRKLFYKWLEGSVTKERVQVGRENGLIVFQGWLNGYFRGLMFNVPGTREICGNFCYLRGRTRRDGIDNFEESSRCIIYLCAAIRTRAGRKILPRHFVGHT